MNAKDPCSVIRPLFSPSQLDNAESRTLNPSNFLVRQLSWALYPLGLTVMRQGIRRQEIFLSNFEGLRLMTILGMTEFKWARWVNYHSTRSKSARPCRDMKCSTNTKMEESSSAVCSNCLRKVISDKEVNTTLWYVDIVLKLIPDSEPNFLNCRKTQLAFELLAAKIQKRGGQEKKEGRHWESRYQEGG